MKTEDDILIVDDEIANLRLLAGLLEQEGYRVRPAEIAQAAIDSARAKPPMLILLAVKMPDIDGFEVCRRLKQDEGTRDIPIIFISALHDAEDRVRGFEAGAVDFISKPFEEREVLARVKTHTRLHRIQLELEQLIEERESELSRSKASLETLLESSQDLYCIRDADGGLVSWNRAFGELVQRLSGIPPYEGMVTWDYAESPDPFFIQRRSQLTKEAFEGKTLREEFTVTMPGSERNFFEITAAPVRADGRVVGVGEFIRDITKRKLAEIGLQESEARFRGVMEQSPYPIVIFNPEGHIEQVNPAWYRVWGVNEEQGAQVMEVYNIVADQQLADLGMTPLIKKAFEGQSVVLPPIQYAGGRGTEELGLPQVGGNTVWIQTLLYPVKDEQGKISFVVNTVVDVTKEKEAENRATAKQEQLQESEARFRSLMEQSPYAIEILNPEGRIEQYNAAWLRLWSITEEQARITLEEYNMLTDPQTVDLGVAAQIKKAFDGEPVVLPPIKYSPAQTSEDFELPFLTDRLRTPWIQCHVFPVKDQAGKVDFVVNTYVDITEQKEAVDQIEAHRERLRALAAELTRTEEQERRRIATELHDGAAQSLAFARLQLTAAQKACADELAADKLTEISQILKESVQQIRAVLLDLSSPALNEIGLSAALSEWLDEHVGRRHDLGTSFVDECGEVPLGRDVRALVFRDARELITNAVKHAEAKNVSVHMAVSDQRLRIVVEDDGQGFDSHAAGQMPGDEGGFGLFSIRERMADVGGRFEIESAPGKGCKATLIVPLEDDTI